VTSYTITINNDLWRLFKEKTPRSKTLNEHIEELIAEKCNYKQIVVKEKKECPVKQPD